MSKATRADALGDIKAAREGTKVAVKRALRQRTRNIDGLSRPVAVVLS